MDSLLKHHQIKESNYSKSFSIPHMLHLIDRDSRPFPLILENGEGMGRLLANPIETPSIVAHIDLRGGHDP